MGKLPVDSDFTTGELERLAMPVRDQAGRDHRVRREVPVHGDRAEPR